MYLCEECGTPYTSPAAMMHCCLTEDRNGYPRSVRGTDWLP